MELLVNPGPAVDGSASGLNALSPAVAGSHGAAAQFLVDNRSCSRGRYQAGSLPLHDAVRLGNASIVKELLATGCDVDALSQSSESPVYLAVKSGNVEILRMLVQHGCRVNVALPGGRVTPLHVAVDHHSCPKLFRALLDALLQGGCDLDAVAYAMLETPLYRAVNFQKTTFSRLLLYQGANPNVSCPFDITMLQVACRQQDARLVETLLNIGVEWQRERWLRFFFHLKGDVTTNQEVNSLLREWRTEPVPLVKLCRIRLRAALGQNLPAKVCHLPLPRLSKKFLLLEELLC